MVSRRVFVGLAFVLACAVQLHADDLLKNLQSDYLNKTLLLRGMYQDESLHFDANGGLLKSGHVGSWTTAYVQIDTFSLKRDAVEIQGIRVAQIGDADGFHPMSTPARVKIKIDEPAMSAEAIRKSLDKVFVGEKESLIPLVPDYWMPIFTRQAEAMLAGYKDSAKEPCAKDATADKPCTVGRMVKAPTLLKSPDPKYPELARQSKFEGTSVLRVIVDETGTPTKILIIKAAGFGIDDNAVETVRTWRFDPARTKEDDRSVPVKINIEVNMRLR